MKNSLAPLILLILGAALPVLGKSADEYFHGGAYKYVAGKQQEARIEVEEGLRRYPDDARLQRLAKQLKDMKDKDPSSGNGDGDKNKDKNKDKKDSKDPNKDKDKDKDKKDGDKKPDEKKDENKQPPEPKESEGKDDKSGKNPPPGQMSEEDAERLLNSFADDEKKEQRERQKLLRKRMETEQDW